MANLITVIGLFLTYAGTAHGEWKSVYPFPYTGWPLPITTSVACPNTTICFVTGGTHSSLPTVQFTTDGFKTVQTTNDTGNTLLLLDITFATDGIHGLAGGVGALKLPALQYTEDGGNDWAVTADPGLVMTERVYSKEGKDFYFTGVVDGLLNTVGIGSSNDGGAHWRYHKWGKDVSVPMDCTPQGGQFFGDTWFIICGSQPQNNPPPPPPPDHAVEHVKKVGRNFELVYNLESKQSRIRRRVSGLTGNFTGAIVKTTDGGKTYTVQMKEVGKYDFYDICCSSETDCIVSASSPPGEGATQPGAYIFHTSDGTTWTQTASFGPPHNSFKCRYEPTSKTYWVGMSSIAGALKSYVYTITSTDGKTWTETGGQVKGFIEMIDFTFVQGSSGKKAYAIAGAIDEVLTPLVYTA